MMVPSPKIRLALARILECNGNSSAFSLLGVYSTNYDAPSDSWNLSDKEAHKVELLCGPYYATVLKVMEINEGANSKA